MGPAKATQVPPALALTSNGQRTAGRELEDLCTALGTSTTNVGELWAIAMVLQLLLAVLPTFPLTGAIHLFSDSEFAINATLKPFASSKASRLAAATRRLFLACSATARVYLHWIPGHAQVRGNERADAGATHGAELSKLGHAPRDINTRINNSLFLTYYPP